MVISHDGLCCRRAMLTWDVNDTINKVRMQRTNRLQPVLGLFVFSSINGCRDGSQLPGVGKVPMLRYWGHRKFLRKRPLPTGCLWWKWQNPGETRPLARGVCL